METVNVNQYQRPDEFEYALNLPFLELLVKYRLKAVPSITHYKDSCYRAWSIFLDEQLLPTMFSEYPGIDFSSDLPYLKNTVSRRYGIKIRKLAKQKGLYAINKKVSDGKGGSERRWWIVNLLSDGAVLSDEVGMLDADALDWLKKRR